MMHFRESALASVPKTPVRPRAACGEWYPEARTSNPTSVTCPTCLQRMALEQPDWVISDLKRTLADHTPRLERISFTLRYRGQDPVRMEDMLFETGITESELILWCADTGIAADLDPLPDLVQQPVVHHGVRSMLMRLQKALAAARPCPHLC